ncbi:MAG: rimI [Burkholderiaceae bacterium]|nr:rimI [Burkholderiaceae bacterium]
MSQFTARPMRVDDLPEVAQLESAVQLDPWTHAQMLDIAPMLHTGEYIGAVVEQSDQLLAYVVARTMFDECEILSVGVANELRGRGLGKQVLQQLFRQLPTQIATVHLEVRVSNAPALRLYQGLGFVEVGCRKGYYAPTLKTPEREDALLMSKPIHTDRTP